MDKNNNQNAVHPEKQKLSKAVDRFAHDIKMRLYQKTDEGYTGWDDDNFKANIIDDLTNDSLEAKGYYVTGEFPPKKLLVDIAARAMFLSRFYNNEGDAQ